MRLWRQLSAHSPVPFGAVLRSLHGCWREPSQVRAELTRRLCDAYGAEDALLTRSGTAALQAALAAVRAVLGTRPVALPAYSCYDVASAAIGADVEAVLYDVDPTTLGPSEPSLDRALGSEPVALVAAHLYGYPIDVRSLARLCEARGTVLIEDAAQEAGGRVDDRPLGSFGALTVLSFGRGKGTTSGGGGALLARGEAGSRLLACAASHLAAGGAGFPDSMGLVAQWLLGRPRLYWLPAALPFLHLGETVYRAPRSLRGMSGAAVCALAVTLRGKDAEVARRRANADRILQWVVEGGKVRPIDVLAGATPGYLRLPVMVPGPAVAEVLTALGRNGVSRAYPSPLGTVRQLGQRVLNHAEHHPGAHALSAGLVTFPTHSRLDERDMRAFATWLRAE